MTPVHQCKKGDAHNIFLIFLERSLPFDNFFAQLIVLQPALNMQELGAESLESDMLTMVKNYFSEFKVLKTASKEFWLVNAMVFFDGLAYFSMMNILSIYLTKNCGFSDFDSGKWIGIYTLLITAFIFGVGAICDTVGIKRSFSVGLGILIITRSIFAVTPFFVKDQGLLQIIVISSMIAMSFGTAFMTPIFNTAMRRFTTKENRSTGFNVYYLIMNIGAIFSGFLVTDGLRTLFGEINGNLAIMLVGMLMNLCAFMAIMFINENNYADPSEKVEVKIGKRPLAIFLEVWKESAFQKLVVFLVLTIGVRLVFTHQFLVMPKYYTRVMQGDFELGFANSINPIIIVVGLIVLIPIINKYNTFKMIVLGMAISAFSLVIMALPIEWTLAIPGIHNLDQAYTFIIFAQIIVFALGELIFSPRFSEYTAMIAPKDKVASYMSLASLPMFIAKPINGFVSGLLISLYSYDGIRAKIDTGNVAYNNSPEFMWFIYFLLALMSPIGVVMMKKYLRSSDEAAPVADDKSQVC